MTGHIHPRRAADRLYGAPKRSPTLFRRCRAGLLDLIARPVPLWLDGAALLTLFALLSLHLLTP